MLIIIYLYKNKEIIINKEYKSDNIQIEYPYIKDKEINNNIYNYMESIIKNNNNYLYIDYDYSLNNDNLNLTIYEYKEYKNIIKRTTKELNINLKNKNIKENKSKTTNKEYNIYQNKIIDKEKPIIALTFDDGPNHNTEKVLSILNKYNIKATFFLLGVNINNNEEIVKKLYESNMEIGNHLYSHKLLSNTKEKEILEEYNKTNNIIYKIINQYPTLTRPSYGNVNQNLKNNIDTPIILWNIDTLDWKYHNSNYISNKVLKKVKNGSIILMHDIYSATANALEKLIPELLKRDYQIVTVTELFYYQNNELEKGKTYRYSK